MCPETEATILNQQSLADSITPAGWSGFLKELHAPELERVERVICGGTCAKFPQKVVDNFDPMKYGTKPLANILDSVVNRGEYILAEDEWKNTHPFNPTNPNPVGKYSFVYDYGPPDLDNTVLWMLQHHKSELKNGEVVDVQPISGERTAVTIQLKDGHKSRVKIANLISSLGVGVQATIKGIMTSMAPIGKYNVEIEISTDPIDIISKSTNQYWTSCETIGGSYDKGIRSDLENINAVAIVRSAPEGKPLPKRWTARYMLRWCKDKGGSPGIGIEPRAYGGNNALNKFVHEKLENILKVKGLLGYDLCITPYEYEGYSDQMASINCENGDAIAYGPGADEWCEQKGDNDEPTQDDYDSLFEEYDHYGVCLLGYENIDFDAMYFEGTLSALLREGAGDYDPRDGFESAVDCIIISEQYSPSDWAIYQKWSRLTSGDLISDIDYWINERSVRDEIDPRTMHKYVLFKKDPDHVMDLLPVVVNEDWPVDYTTVEYRFENIEALHDAFSKASGALNFISGEHDRGEINDEMYKFVYADALVNMRNDLLLTAGINASRIIEIPADFDEAVEKLSKVEGLSSVCTSLREGLGFDPNVDLWEKRRSSNIERTEIYHRPDPLFNSVFMQKATIPYDSNDINEPCGPLVPLAYVCKLPMFEKTEDMHNYKKVPFEVWSKDPKWRCPLGKPEQDQ